MKMAQRGDGRFLANTKYTITLFSIDFPTNLRAIPSYLHIDKTDKAEARTGDGLVR
ncbi:MAG: hypothetical protein WBI53_07655 [Paludibacter sp.]